jgi:hypothetical protein
MKQAPPAAQQTYKVDQTSHSSELTICSLDMSGIMKREKVRERERERAVEM